MRIPPAGAGHLLPDHFGSLSPTPPEAVPVRRHRLWVAAGGIVLTCAAGAGTHLWSHHLYDTTAEEFHAEVIQQRDAQDDLLGALGAASDLADDAASLASVDNGLLSDPASVDALVTTLDAAAAERAEGAAAAAEPVPAVSEKPFWTWELLSEAGALGAALPSIQAGTVAVQESTEAIEKQSDAVEQAADALLISATGAVSDFEVAYVSARNDRVIDLRVARDAVESRVVAADAQTADAYERLNAAASAVMSSHADQLAQKAGPLFSARMTVEEYARSIAGGVLLDVEWRQIVNGRGLGGSAGGLATWHAGHGGYATITLSNSVAERWPADVMRALVTHEVGHAISAKCHEMFDWQDRDANEEWATAWALSMGHTADGNGVSLYGYPPQELIDTAATCR